MSFNLGVNLHCAQFFIFFFWDDEKFKGVYWDDQLWSNSNPSFSIKHRVNFVQGNKFSSHLYHLSQMVAKWRVLKDSFQNKENDVVNPKNQF